MTSPRPLRVRAYLAPDEVAALDALCGGPEGRGRYLRDLVRAHLGAVHLVVDPDGRLLALARTEAEARRLALQREHELDDWSGEPRGEGTRYARQHHHVLRVAGTAAALAGLAVTCDEVEPGLEAPP